MRKIVIFGTGKGGRHLFEESKKRKDIEVVAFLDNYQDGSIEGVQIYKPSVFLECEQKNEYEYYITAGAQKTVKIMLDILLEFHIKDVYVMQDIAGKNGLSIVKDGAWDTRWIHKMKFEEERPVIHYFEVPVTDQCNLNCRGCIFGCNSMQMGNEHVDTRQVVADIKRMAELFCDVPWVRILGGEPLMHPDIMEILSVARASFPDAEIDLCTNGILIPKLDEKIFQELEELNISIHVSGYPPTERMAEKIECVLKKYHLPYTFLHRPEFFKFYTKAPIHQMIQNYENCPTSGCWEVYRGKIMRCSAVIAYQKLNKQFGTKYDIVENVDWFDLYSDEWDGVNLKKALNHASHACKYCDLENKEMFDWHNGGKPELSDYVLSEG
ncbi:MAG: radical SAM protein [Lachnospiraceae bacterium]|nr:radical SAM protein [Lachnospiraceae bacterium]